MEITSSRVINAPQASVYGAFADPAALVQWWGPAGFTNRIVQFELRAGGTWQIVMRAPDGAEYDNHSIFIEVLAPERIVYDHLQPVHRFRMTMRFVPITAATTELTWTMSFERAAENEKLRGFILQANEQNFDRLDDFLRRHDAQA